MNHKPRQLTPRKARIILRYLEGQFDWLGNDNDEASSADVVEHLGQIHETLTELAAKAKPRKKK